MCTFYEAALIKSLSHGHLDPSEHWPRLFCFFLNATSGQHIHNQILTHYLVPSAFTDKLMFKMFKNNVEQGVKAICTADETMQWRGASVFTCKFSWQRLARFMNTLREEMKSCFYPCWGVQLTCLQSWRCGSYKHNWHLKPGQKSASGRWSVLSF